MVDIGIVMVGGVILRIIVPGTSQTGNQIAWTITFPFLLGLVRIGIDIDPVFCIRFDVSEVRRKMRNRINGDQGSYFGAVCDNRRGSVATPAVAQPTDCGDVVNQATGEAVAEPLVVEVGCGVPGGQRQAEALGLGVGRQLKFADETLVTNAGERVAQQGMGAADGAGVAQWGVAPGGAAAGPAAAFVPLFVGVEVRSCIS